MNMKTKGIVLPRKCWEYCGDDCSKCKWPKINKKREKHNEKLKGNL